MTMTKCQAACACCILLCTYAKRTSFIVLFHLHRQRHSCNLTKKHTHTTVCLSQVTVIKSKSSVVLLFLLVVLPTCLVSQGQIEQIGKCCGDLLLLVNGSRER